jgi:hypothetical protein
MGKQSASGWLRRKTGETVTQGECLLCGCTQAMACLDTHGSGCSWISHEPPICSECGRVWAVVQGLTKHPGNAGSFQALKTACREHREEGYRCG